ncbi:MAG: hypothetical protein LBI13_08565 [Streptococcaceae bacterium]|nr:hypothetical protein [Streptococcaceae bacterium]
MRIFYLEDDPCAVSLPLNYLQSYGHEVFLATNLNKAVELLHYNPKADSFHKYFFDVSLPAEIVFYPNEKNPYSYNCKEGLNGVRFLLHNVRHLDRHNSLASNVAIITAHTNRVRKMPPINMNGVLFEVETLASQKQRHMKGDYRVPQIAFKANTQEEYTFSLLDKASEDIMTQIKDFVSC